VREAEEAAGLGLGGLLLFGLPEAKDEQGSGAWDDDGIVQKGLRALKESPAAKKLVLIADVCLCEYTSHGHCGVVVETRDGFEVENDSTLTCWPDRCLAGSCRSRRRGSQRHDGRPRRSHPQRPRRRGL